MATVPANRRIERAGVNALRSFLEEHDHLVQEIAGGTDHGEDCFVMLTRQRKRTGYAFTAQVKTGKKYKRARGYAIDVGHHFADWSSSKVPVIGVVYDIDEQRMFWTNLTLYLTSSAVAPSWVPIARENELCAATIDAFVSHIEEFTDAPEKLLADGSSSEGTPPPRPQRGRRKQRPPFHPPVLQWARDTAVPDSWQPQVADGYVVVRHRYLIRVLDTGSGAEVWSGRTAFGRLSPLGDEAVYVSATAGRLRALDLRSGRTRWEQPLRVRDDLAVCASKTLYIPDEKGRIFALGTRNGTMLWASAPARGHLAAPLLVNSGTVLSLRTMSPEHRPTAESVAREVVALNATDGTERWRHRAEADLSPVWTLTDDALYVVERPDDSSSVLVAVELSTGWPLWRAPLPAQVTSAAVVSGNCLYVAGLCGGLYRISRADGAYQQIDTTVPLRASPVVADNSVMVNLGRALASFNATTGVRRWRRRLPGLALGQPFVLGGAVYIGHRAGTWAFDIQSGRRVWSDELVWDPERQGDPVPMKDALYVTDRRGIVRGFRTS
jgi:outer membrane protein assembly factor BamB